MQKILILLVAILIAGTVKAQIGIKAGITVGATYGSPENFNGGDIESVDPAIGYQFGVTKTLVQLAAFRLNAELLYEDRRGVKDVNFELSPVEGVSIQNSVEFKNSFKYLSLPLLATFGTEKLNFYVGPSFSYLLSASSETTTRTTVLPAQASGTNGLPETGVTEGEIDFIDDYEDPYINRFNVAANVGVMFPIFPRTSLDIRVYHSFTDVTNDDEDQSIIDRAVRNPEIRLRDDNDNTVGLQANLIYHF